MTNIPCGYNEFKWSGNDNYTTTDNVFGKCFVLLECTVVVTTNVDGCCSLFVKA